MLDEEITNNLRLAVHLYEFQPDQRQKEYQRLLPVLGFKVKSFGYLIKKYEEWKGIHGSSDSKS